MKQITPKKKGGNSEKKIQVTHPKETMTTRMSGIKLRGKYKPGNPPRTYTYKMENEGPLFLKMLGFIHNIATTSSNENRSRNCYGWVIFSTTTNYFSAQL